jgi:hypothetical protein
MSTGNRLWDPGLPALFALPTRTAKPGGISAVLARDFRPLDVIVRRSDWEMGRYKNFRFRPTIRYGIPEREARETSFNPSMAVKWLVFRVRRGRPFARQMAAIRIS